MSYEFDHSTPDRLKEEKAQVQLLDYFGWMNSVFENAELEISVKDVNDFSDAICLMKLLEIFTGDYTHKYKANPTKFLLKNDNCNIALNWMQELGIDIRFVSGHNIVSGDTMSILSVLFALKRKYGDSVTESVSRVNAVTGDVVKKEKYIALQIEFQELAEKAVAFENEIARLKELLLKNDITEIEQADAPEENEKDKVVQILNEKIKDLIHEVKEKDRLIKDFQEISDASERKLMREKKIRRKHAKTIHKYKQRDRNLKADSHVVSIQKYFRLFGNESIMQKKIARETRVSSLCRVFLAKANKKILVRKLYACKELLGTEISYIENLERMISDYIIPIRESGLLDEETRNKIVSERSINVILAYAKHFKTKLEEVINDNLNFYTSIGTTINQVASFFKVYISYVNDYDECTKTFFKTMKENSEFQVLIRNLEKKDIFQAFLILPIQRVPRYVMLLADIVKHTPYYHTDYEDLKDCLVNMQDVAATINAAKAIADSQMQVLEITSKFYDKNSTVAQHIKNISGKASRKYIDQCSMSCSLNEKKEAELSIYLFNDLILVGKGEKLVKYIGEVTLTSSSNLTFGGLSILVKTPGEEASQIELYFESNKEFHIWKDILLSVLDELISIEEIRNPKFHHLTGLSNLHSTSGVSVASQVTQMAKSPKGKGKKYRNTIISTMSLTGSIDDSPKTKPKRKRSVKTPNVFKKKDSKRKEIN